MIFDEYNQFYNFYSADVLHSLLTYDDCLVASFQLISWIPLESQFHFFNLDSVFIDDPTDWFLYKLLLRISQYFTFNYNLSAGIISSKDMVKITRIVSHWIALLLNLSIHDGGVQFIEGIHDKTMPSILRESVLSKKETKDANAEDSTKSPPINSTEHQIPQQSTILKRIIIEMIQKNVLVIPMTAGGGNQMNLTNSRRGSGVESVAANASMLFSSHFFATIHQFYQSILNHFQNDFLLFLPESISKKILKDSHPAVTSDRLKEEIRKSTSGDIDLLDTTHIDNADNSVLEGNNDLKLDQLRVALSKSFSSLPTFSGVELFFFQYYQYFKQFSTIASLQEFFHHNFSHLSVDVNVLQQLVETDFMKCLEIILYLHDELFFLTEQFLM